MDRGGSRGGSRRLIESAPVPSVQPTFKGTPVRVTIERMDRGAALAIEGAQWLAEMFFRFERHRRAVV